MKTSGRYLTAAEVAERLKIDKRKIIEWITSGELRAVNVATDTSQRPQWRIPPDAVIEFEQQRAGGKKTATKKRRGNRRTETLTRHFE